MGEDLLETGLDGDAVFGAENFRSAVLDKLIGPSDAGHRGVDAGIVQIFDHRRAESVVEHVILQGAEDGAFPGIFFETGAVEGLDPAGIDEGDGITEGFEAVPGLFGDFE